MRKVIYQLILFLYTNAQDDVYALAARNILKNIHKIDEYSITDLAKVCYVSPATISRLCRKLGFESFADFKAIAHNGSGVIHRDKYFPKYHEMIEAKTPYEELLAKQVDAIVDTIQCSYQSIDFDTISNICNVIHKADKVIFIGHHTAQLSSIQFQERLVYLGKDCYGSLNLNDQLDLIQTAKKNDVIILGSLTGAFAVSNSNIVRHFKHSPATKIVFSNHPELIAASTYCIDTKGDTDSLISKFTLTYLFDLLEMIYTNKYGK